MRKLPLLIVEWDDITTHSGWEWDDKSCSDKVLRCVSVGWKVKSGKGFLELTPMRSESKVSKYSKCDDRQVIPRGCIRSIRRLE